MQNELNEFSRTLDWYPGGYHGNRLNLLLLSDVHLISDPLAYLHSLDAPGLVNEEREFCVDPEVAWPFPEFHLGKCPEAMDIQQQLTDGTDRAKQFLPTQRDLAGMVTRRAEALHPDVVLLMIADGLSYYDLDEATGAEPCIVEGVTITSQGYRQVLGSPPLSVRLFGAGYREQRGYSFFDVENNSLANELYSPFGVSQITRIHAFDECLKDLESRPVDHAYVQVALPGLDGVCHAHWDVPPIEAYKCELLHKFSSAVDCLSRQHKRVLAYLTSDHGILWRDQFEPDTWRVVHDLPPESSNRPRYVPGAIMRAYTVVLQSSSGPYSALKFPYIARQWKSNEWGMHGGVSAWESIVPIITAFAG